MKAEIKLYNSNATIFTQERTMDIHYDADSICPEEYEDVNVYLDEVKNEIIEELGNIENIDDIIEKIEIKVDPLW